MAVSTITFSGDNTKLFTKVPVENFQQTLIIPETHNAILLKDGQMLQTLSTGKYAISNFVDEKTETDCTIEVLFMSKTAKLKMRWGTSQNLLMFDEEKNSNYQIGLSGFFEVQIGDPRKCYLYLIGADNDLSAEVLQERLQSTVVGVVQNVLIDYVKQNKVPQEKVPLHKEKIAEKVLTTLSHKLLTEYGIAVFSFDIANTILRSKESSNKTCAECGYPLPAGVNFCPHCGKRVEKICPNCHAKNANDALFCVECGQKL